MHWGKVVTHVFILVLLFLVVAIFVNPLTDGIENDTLRVVVKESTRIVVTVGLLYLYTRRFLKKSHTYYRIQEPVKVNILWVMVGLALPLILIAFYILSGSVTIEGQDPISYSDMLSFIVISFISACSAGIIEEFLFRGYLFKILEDKWNVATAVIVTSILFGALHLLTLNEMQLLDVGLTLVAGTLIGILFCVIILNTGNVWNVVVVHALWNFIFHPNMVQFVIQNGESHASIVLFKFKSDNVWLTGGAFGIESSIPALIVYIVAIVCLAYYKPASKNDSVPL